MADKILLEDASGGILLEDGTGVLLIERFIVPDTADGFTTSDTTPTLEFTGLDPEGEDISYQVQVDPADTFDSTVTMMAEYTAAPDADLNVSDVDFMAFGQSFRGDGGELRSAEFALKKLGSPTGNATVQITTDTGGSFGTDSLPGTTLATSDNFDVSTLTTSFATITFNFTGAERIILEDGVPYLVVFLWSGGGINDKVIGRALTTLPTHEGNLATNTIGNWIADNSSDAPFRVNKGGALIDAYSEEDAGFVNTVTGGDLTPFNSGEKVSFTAQDDLDPGVYYWHARGIDIALEPVVEEITTSAFASGTSHNVSMPATVNAGDLLITIFVNDGDATRTNPSGWTSLGTNVNGTAVRVSFAVKKAAGTEGGTTVDWVTSADEAAAAQTWRVRAGTWRDSGTLANDVEKSAGTGTSNAPLPSALDPAWGIEKTLWFAYYGADDQDDVNTFPPGYTVPGGGLSTYTQSDASATACSMASAYKVDRVEDEEASGGFVINASEEWVAGVIGVRPLQGGGDTWSDWTETRDFEVTESGTTYFETPTASLSFSGALARSTSKPLSAALSFAGAVSKRPAKTLTAALSFAGTIQKSVAKSLSAALSFSGALATAHIFNVALSGALSFSGALTLKTSKTLTAGLSFSGALSRQTSKALSAGLSFAGALSRTTNKALAGAVSFTGALTKTTVKTLAGALSFSGAIELQKFVSQALSATLSFSGALSRQTNKTLTAGLSFTGTLNRRLAKLLFSLVSFGQYSTYEAAVLADAPKLYLKLDDRDAGTVAEDFSGNNHDGTYNAATVTRHGAHGSPLSVRGAIGVSEALSVAHHTDFNVTAAMVELWVKIAGSSTKVGHTQLFNKRSGASEDFGANLYSSNGTRWNFVFPFGLMGSNFISIPGSAKTDKELWVHVVVGYSQSIVRAWINGVSVGSYTPSAWDANRSFPLEIMKDTGSYVDEFSFYNFYDDTLPARHYQAMFENSLLKSTAKTLTGALSFSGAVSTIKFASQALSASLSFVGTLSRSTLKTFAGSVGFSGALSRSASKFMAGTLSFSGSLSRTAGKLLAGVLSFAGNLSRTTNKALAAALSFSGVLDAVKIATTFYTQALSATLSFSGNLSKSTSKTLSGDLSFAGNLNREVRRALSASLSFSGSLVKTQFETLAGTLSFSGALNRTISKSLSGVLTFAASIQKQTQKRLTASLSFVGSLATFWVWIEIQARVMAVFLTMSHWLGSVMSTRALDYPTEQAYQDGVTGSHQPGAGITVKIKGAIEVAYKRGTNVLFGVTFTDPKTGNLFDPDPGTIKLYCKLVSTGVYLTGYTRAGGGKTMTKLSTGEYEADVQFELTDTVGQYEVEMEGMVGTKRYLDSLKVAVKA